MNNTLIAETTDALAEECREFANNYSGNCYFKDLALLLAEKLKVSYVLIGHLLRNDANKIETVVLVANGQVVGNMTYSLYGTPCENVVGRNCCYFPSNVRAMFPDDKELHDLGIESYIGSPLFNNNKEPLGLIVLMNESIIPNARSVEKILEAVAERTEKELQALLN